MFVVCRSRVSFPLFFPWQDLDFDTYVRQNKGLHQGKNLVNLMGGGLKTETHGRNRGKVVSLCVSTPCFTTLLSQQMDVPIQEHALEPQTPQPGTRYAVGDTVNVFQGTGAYVRGRNTIAFIGTIVGFDATDGKWLVLVYLVFLCHALSRLLFISFLCLCNV